MTPDSPQMGSRSAALWRLADRSLRAVMLLLSGFFLLLFLYAAARRFSYPFELEWIESGILTSVLRIVHGQGLYVAPSLHFVPFLYAPLYLYLTAAVTRLTGIGANDYAAMRLVSIVASLGTAGLIYAFIRAEVRSLLAATAGAGLYLASYTVLGTFFDIGRVDSLFVFFIVLALLLQRRGSAVLAALVWILAFQTKQSVLPLAVVVLLADWRTPRRLVGSLSVFLLGALGSVLLLNHLTAGWYVFYVFGVTRALGLLWRQAALYWPATVLQPFQLAWGLVAAALLFTRIHWRGAAAWFYGLVSVALFGGVWVVEAHRGASSNAAMPIVAWTCILFGVAIGRLLQTDSPGFPGTEAPSRRSFPRGSVLVLLAAAGQLFSLTYNAGGLIPAPPAYAAGREFVQELRALPGDVYVLNHGHDAVLAGKQPFAEGEALGAVIDARLPGISQELHQEFLRSLAQHRYSAVVIDDPSPTETSWKADGFYPLAISAPALDKHYLTSQPEWYLLPCAPPAALFAAVNSPTSIVFAKGCATAAADPKR